MIERSRDIPFGAPARKRRAASKKPGRGTPAPSAQAKALRDHTTAVQHRLLPHLRRAARTMRPAWIERRVQDLVA